MADQFEDIQDKIDAYISGIMPENERVSFEKELNNDPELAKEVHEAQEVLASLEAFETRKDIRTTVQHVHSEMSQHNQKSRSKVVITKRRRFLSTLAIAASVSIITFISTLSIMRRNAKEMTANETNKIQRLSSVVESISDDQRTILDRINFLEEQNEEPSSLGIGSCFLIDDEGYFLTSNHLVMGARGIRLSRQGDSLITFDAKVVFKDPQRDLALLKTVDSLEFSAPNYVLSSEAPRLGDYLFTLGYPKNDIVFGEGSLSSKTGHKGDTNSYQISIPANPGNSGGPVVNEQGEISGMISGRHSQNEAATYAITAETIGNFVEKYHAQLDSTSLPLELNQSNRLRRMKRPDKIEAIEGFVYRVEAEIPRKR